MKKPTANPRRVLGHLKRLMRAGDIMLHDRPLDELSHALWCDRVTKYIRLKMPDAQILRVDELLPIAVPDLMDRNRPRSNPIDAALARANSSRDLTKIYMTILASVIERLELQIENNKE